MQQVVLANGKLWAGLDTGLIIEGDAAPRAGVAYFVINPHAGKVQQQGCAGILGNLTYCFGNNAKRKGSDGVHRVGQ